MRLLEKNPEDRPDSAYELCEVVQRELGIAFPTSVDRAAGCPGPPRRQTSVGFVGREQPLQVVRNFVHQAFHPPDAADDDGAVFQMPSVLFVSGEAGMGKTYLLNQAVRLAQRRGARVYQGRCFEGSPAPFQPVVDILRQLLADTGPTSRPAARRLAAGGHDGFQDRWPGSTALAPTVVVDATFAHNDLGILIEDYSAEILRVAPELRAWIPGEAFQQLDIEREANYVLRALATFFAQIGTVSPTLICFDDLQWADASTLNLLRQLASALLRSRQTSVECGESWPQLAIACTLRKGDSPAEALARSLMRNRLGHCLDLPPFCQAETRLLAARLLRRTERSVPDSVVAQLQKMSDGNPFFVREIVNASQLSQNADGAERALEVCWPDSVKQALAARLHSLPRHAAALAEMCSVAGPVVSVDLLQSLMSHLSEGELFDAIDELLSRKVMLESSNGDELQFSHDLLRELAGADLTQVRRQTLHRRIAEALETLYSTTNPEKLAAHFLAADEADQAFRYLVEAGEHCLRAYAVDDAVRHLRRAESLYGRISHPAAETELRLRSLLATSLAAAGDPAGAIEQYRLSLSIATDSAVRARLSERLGEQHFRIGNFSPAVEALDRSLGELGMSPPASWIGVLSGTATSFCRYLWPARLHSRRVATDRQTERATIALDAYNTLTYLWGQRHLARVAHASGRQLVLARRLGDPARLATVYAQQSLFCGLFSFNRLGMLVGRRAARLAALADDSLVSAIVDGQIGCVHYFGGRLCDAERIIRQALTTIDRRGDSWFRLFFYHNLRHLYSIRGDADSELQAARLELEISETVRDPEGCYYAEYGLANALARMGDLAAAHEHISRAIARIVQTNLVAEPTAWQTYGYVHLQAGDYRAAREVLERSHALIRKHWAYLDYAIRCLPLLVESTLGPHWRHPAEISGNDLRQAWKLSRKSLFWCRRFPNYLPHALRVHGRVAYALGRQRPAIAAFRAAVDAAQRLESPYERARALVDLSSVSEDDRDQADEARRLLDQIKAVLPRGEGE
jgi:tetratricopeptide (TPR) repeat protein